MVGLGVLLVVGRWIINAIPNAESDLAKRYEALPVAGDDLDPQRSTPTASPFAIPLVDVVEPPFAFQFPDTENRGDSRRSTNRSRSSNGKVRYEAVRDNVTVQVSIVTTPDVANESGKNHRLLAGIEAADALLQRNGFLRKAGPARIDRESPSIAMTHWHPTELRSAYTLMVWVDDHMLHLIQGITYDDPTDWDAKPFTAGSPIPRSVRVISDGSELPSGGREEARP